MALFGLGKKKKEAAVQPMPPAPIPPDSLQVQVPHLNIPDISKRHIDDLEKKEADVTEGPLFPEIPKLEINEIAEPEEKNRLPPEIPRDSETDISKTALEEEFPKEITKISGFQTPRTKSTEERELAAPKIEAPKIKIPDRLPEIEDFEIPPEVPGELPELETHEQRPLKKAPLFINVDSYAEMIEQLNVTRAKLNEYLSSSSRVLEIRAKKDESMEKWRNLLEDIERKLISIDYIMFEGGSVKA